MFRLIVAVAAIAALCLSLSNAYQLHERQPVIVYANAQSDSPDWATCKSKCAEYVEAMRPALPKGKKLDKTATSGIKIKESGK